MIIAKFWRFEIVNFDNDVLNCLFYNFFLWFKHGLGTSMQQQPKAFCIHTLILFLAMICENGLHYSFLWVNFKCKRTPFYSFLADFCWKFKSIFILNSYVHFWAVFISKCEKIIINETRIELKVHTAKKNWVRQNIKATLHRVRVREIFFHLQLLILYFNNKEWIYWHLRTFTIQQENEEKNPSNFRILPSIYCQNTSLNLPRSCTT